MRKLSSTQKNLLIRASREKTIHQSDCRTAYSLVDKGLLEFIGGAPNNRPTSVFAITSAGARYVSDNYQDESEQGK